MRNEEFSSGQPAEGLSAEDKTVLDIARRHANSPRGALDREVRETLDVSPTSYWMKVLRLIDNPHAQAHDPATVNRLRSVKERGSQQQSANRDARTTQ